MKYQSNPTSIFYRSEFGPAFETGWYRTSVHLLPFALVEDATRRLMLDCWSCSDLSPLCKANLSMEPVDGKSTSNDHE